MADAAQPVRSGAHHAVLAGFLGWTLDAFDFFIVVFLSIRLLASGRANTPFAPIRCQQRAQENKDR